MARRITRLVVHCAASPNGRALSSNGLTAAQVIDGWHRARGFKRDWRWRADVNPGLESIGYHWIIDLDGRVLTGRAQDEVGAHAIGHNFDSLGACLVGTDRFTVAQWHALRALVADVRRTWPTVRVLGHRDLPGVAKTCPGFDVTAWDVGAREPVHGHVCAQDPA